MTGDRVRIHNHPGFRRIIIFYDQIIECIRINQRNILKIGDPVKNRIFIGMWTEGSPRMRFDHLVVENLNRAADCDDKRFFFGFFVIIRKILQIDLA